MHELSIARSILEIAQQAAEEQDIHHPGLVMRAIHVRIGALSGVDAASLQFSFDAAKLDTPAREAQLHLEPVPVKTQCTLCNQVVEGATDYSLLCGSCGGILVLLSGKELQVEFVDFE
jgi:hydrogenase nickel incorporation protein HypA/HybF